MSAGAQAPPKGSTEPMKVHFYVKALGEDLFTPIDEESKDPIKKEDDLKEDYPVDYEIPFTIGPIPCSIKFGFTATIGVKYGLYLTPLYVDAKVTPYVHTDAWAKCGVDLIIVSAGVRFDLVLVNEDLEFGGELGLATDKPDPYVHILLYGKQNLTALAGKFKAFVSVDLFFWSDEWDWTIFDWDGFRYSDFMFQYGRDIDLRTGQVSDITVTKGVRVKIRHIAVDHNALKNWVKDKGYFAYAFIVPSGTQINRDNDRDITDYYKNKSWDGQGQENLYPFPTWILAKKVLTAPGQGRHLRLRLLRHEQDLQSAEMADGSRQQVRRRRAAHDPGGVRQHHADLRFRDQDNRRPQGPGLGQGGRVRDPDRAGRAGRARRAGVLSAPARRRGPRGWRARATTNDESGPPERHRPLPPHRLGLRPVAARGPLPLRHG